MYGYAGQSATASQVTPFSSPPQTTEPGGSAAQSATVAQATGTSGGTSAQSALSQLTSAVPSSLQSLATPAAADPPSLDDLLPLVIGLELFETTGSASLPSRNALATSTIGFALATRGFNTGELPVPIVPGVLYPPIVGPATAAPAMSAGLGEAGTVGALSVPPNWATATPAVRLAASVLQGTSQVGAPLVATAGQGEVFGQMALGGLAGSAIGGSASRAAVQTGSRGRDAGSGDMKDSAGDGKGSKTEDKLKRVLAELSQKPESVQHWHTDKAHLEGLLEQLSTKPGVHAVHVSSRNKPNPSSSQPRWG